MSHQYRNFTVTIPAGTPKTAPAVTDVSFPPFVVAGVRILVPPGPNGVMGFQVLSGGQQFLPWNLGEFLVTSNERLIFVADQWPDTGSWQIAGYNTGQYPHTIYVTFELNPISVEPAGPGAVDLAALSSPAAELVPGEGGGLLPAPVESSGGNSGAPAPPGAAPVLTPVGGIGGPSGFEAPQ